MKTIRGLEILDGNWSEKVSTFCGTPGVGGGLARSPRYLLPALARAMGGTPADWQAASWTILSSVPNTGTPRQYWRSLWRYARQERSQTSGD